MPPDAWQQLRDASFGFADHGLAGAGRRRAVAAVSGGDDLRWISGYVSTKEPRTPPLWWHHGRGSWHAELLPGFDGVRADLAPNREAPTRFAVRG
jgi:hypothetical protein